MVTTARRWNLEDFPKMLTGNEVAELFDVDPKTVTRWGRAGKVTVIKPPGGVGRNLYLASEIYKMLDTPSEGNPHLK